MSTKSLRGSIAAALAAVSLAVAGPARGGDPPAGPAAAPPARLPFSDDVAPPPPLPTPIDRTFAGEMTEFNGERVTLKWDWTKAAHLADFESFVPVRSTLSGGFAVRTGRLACEGTAGIRLRLAMVSDLEMHAAAVLKNPHDLGLVLGMPGSSDESILCLVQDILFTKFDGAAGNTNMINKLGGIPASAPGMVEFRYVCRSIQPRLAPGTEVQFDLVRKGAETQFVITPKGADPVNLKGKDTDTPMTRFQPGLYTSGGSAEYGPLTISGKIDPVWCAAHGVLPYVAGNLLHPANRWKPPEKKLAETVEKYAHQDPAAERDPKKLVPVEAIAPLVGDVNVPLVIRIRAAEALIDSGDTATVADRLAPLLDSKDEPARILAWQILRPRLPWHFFYEVDASAKVRREAAHLIGAYLRERDDAEAQGKVFVDGYWYTPDRADEIRASWDRAWELRTPRIRLRTNLSKKWADWYLLALDAEYTELVRLVGKEPPAANLPLSVFVFRDAAGFTEFCTKRGYETKAAWGRFTDLDRNVSFTTFDTKDGLANAMGQVAKQFHRFATGKHWPGWFEEGRASWFGNADYQTVSFDGTTLKVGLRAQGSSIRMLAQAAKEGRLPSIAATLVNDPRTQTPEQRRLWYAEAWALHAWLMEAAPEAMRGRFAEWQSAMEKIATSPRDVEDTGFKEFMLYFARDLAEMDRLFAEWVKAL